MYFLSMVSMGLVLRRFKSKIRLHWSSKGNVRRVTLWNLIFGLTCFFFCCFFLFLFFYDNMMLQKLKVETKDT